MIRARPCRPHSIDLARAVHSCYLLDPETAGAIAAPAADALLSVLPETWLEKLAAGLPPANAAGTLLTVFNQCRENERLIIARWNEQQARMQAASNGHGDVPDPAPYAAERPSDYVGEE